MFLKYFSLTVSKSLDCLCNSVAFIVIYLLFTETPYFSLSLSLTMSLSCLAMHSRACVFIFMSLRTFPSIKRNEKKSCRHKYYLKIIIIIQTQWHMEAMSNYVDFHSIIVKVGRKSTHKLVRNSFASTAL